MSIFRKIVLAACAQLTIIGLCVSTASAVGKRVALVIGNGNYQNTIGLPNALNDADAMAIRLRQLGFEVTKGKDLTQAGMYQILKKYRNQTRGAEIALFFYAGHGMQSKGRNFLIPIDALLKEEGDLEFEAVGFKDKVLRQMNSAQAKVVMLDACRNNPLEKKMLRGDNGERARSTGASYGLTAVDASEAAGTLIAFATSPGKIALDGKSGNSPFTEALLKHLGDKVDIDVMMKRVRGAVARRTGQRQQPWTNSSINGDLFLAGRPAVIPVVVASTKAGPATTAATGVAAPQAVVHSGGEISFWNSLHRDGKGTIAEYQVYLSQHPGGMYAALARSRIADLSNRPTQVASVAQYNANSTARGYSRASARPSSNSYNNQPAAPSYQNNQRTAAYNSGDQVRQGSSSATAPADRTSQKMLGLNRGDWRDVQARLIALGHGTGRADGVAGSNTRRAISNWQSAKGYATSGYLDRSQYSALMSQYVDPARLAAVRSGRSVSTGARKSARGKRASRSKRAVRRKGKRRSGSRKRAGNSSAAAGARAMGNFVGGVARGFLGK